METLLRPEVLAVLALGASIAGFVDTLAGGGGLITVPLLLLTGLPPLAALATNKVQGSFGTLVATIALLRRRHIFIGEVRGRFAATFCGGLVGAGAVRLIDPAALDVLIPVILVGIALYFLFAPRAGDIEGKPRLGATPYQRFVLPAVGFYDGFFGLGTGSFYALAGVALRGQTLLRATAFAKVLNFGSNFGAVLFFLFSGKVVWLAGAVMICGQIAGAYAGSLAMIGGGARLIRPMIVLMCFAMILRYAWQKGLVPAGLH